MQVRHCYINLQTRKVDVQSWRPEGRHQPSEDQVAHGCTWATTLKMPICSPKRLLPTFCSALAALRYTLRVRLHVRGMYHSPFTLDVPLQVLSCREGENAGDESIVQDFYPQGTGHDLFSISGTLQVSCAYIAITLISLIYHRILGWKHYYQIMMTVEFGSQDIELQMTRSDGTPWIRHLE
jgi:hypothetical protein